METMASTTTTTTTTTGPSLTTGTRCRLRKRTNQVDYSDPAEERLTKKKPRVASKKDEDIDGGATKPTREQIKAAIEECTEVLEPMKGNNGKDYMGVQPDSRDPKKFRARIKFSGMTIEKTNIDTALDAAIWYTRAKFVTSTLIRDGKAKSNPNSKIGRKRAAHNTTRAIVGARNIAVVTTLSIVRTPGHVIQHENGQQNIRFQDLRESDLLMGNVPEALTHAATMAFRAKLIEQFCGKTPSTTSVDDYIKELIMTKNVRFMVKRRNKLWGSIGGAKYVVPRIKVYIKQKIYSKVANTNDDDY